MKMDCYPRFKKSDLAKECLLAEMEGKPLPIEAAAPQTQQKSQQQSQYTGIWKRHRVGGVSCHVTKSPDSSLSQVHYHDIFTVLFPRSSTLVARCSADGVGLTIFGVEHQTARSGVHRPKERKPTKVLVALCVYVLPTTSLYSA